MTSPLPGIGLAQLTASRCRWPVAGDGATLRYCGATKPDLVRPYCEAHRCLAYKRPAPSRATIAGAVRA